MLKGLPILAPEPSYSLRVSVLEHCQYQCPYCLPGTVKPFAHKPSWLTTSEYRSIAIGLSRLPITKIRFTGGEPLLRPNLFEISSVFRETLPDAVLSITTNGQHLRKSVDKMLGSGITRVNVHIDSLRPDKYRKIMGNGDVNDVVSTLHEIKDRLNELKINVVIQKGVNDDELCDFIEFSQTTGIEVRFIELMDTGSAKNYVKNTFLSGADAIRLVEKKYSVQKSARRHASDPAALYQIAEHNVQFGLIASDTQPFCADCNRLRLNAQGELRGCLYQPSGVGLGSMLRSGQTSQMLANAIDAAVNGKRSFHPLVAGPKYQFSMAEIGG